MQRVCRVYGLIAIQGVVRPGQAGLSPLYETLVGRFATEGVVGVCSRRSGAPESWRGCRGRRRSRVETESIRARRAAPIREQE